MEKIKLWDKNTPYYNESYNQRETEITPFLTDNENDEKRGCVIVCPGGGYSMRADHEGAPVAEMFKKSGINAFVLDYRVDPYRHPAMLLDINRAVRHVRYNADKYGIDPQKIAVLGFSAGGHLAACAATHFDYGIQTGDAVDRVSSRPDAAILCYPVISLIPPYFHEGTRKLLLGGYDNEDELAHELSGHLSVKNDTPPVFLWHTAEDDGVPVENSLMMATALSAKKIPFELHIFPNGGHGLGLAEDLPGTDKWGSLEVDWLHRMGY